MEAEKKKSEVVFRIFSHCLLFYTRYRDVLISLGSISTPDASPRQTIRVRLQPCVFMSWCVSLIPLRGKLSFSRAGPVSEVSLFPSKQRDVPFSHLFASFIIQVFLTWCIDMAVMFILYLLFSYFSRRFIITFPLVFTLFCSPVWIFFFVLRLSSFFSLCFSFVAPVPRYSVLLSWSFLCSLCLRVIYSLFSLDFPHVYPFKSGFVRPFSFSHHLYFKGQTGNESGSDECLFRLRVQTKV